MNPTTLEEKLFNLDVKNMTTRDLRVAAKVALTCGDQALARALREEHDNRLTMMVNEKGYAYALNH